MTEVNQCVTCGKNIPEGDQLCNVCKNIIAEPKKEIRIDDLSEVRAAAVKIKDFCLSRIHKQKTGAKNARYGIFVLTNRIYGRFRHYE